MRTSTKNHAPETQTPTPAEASARERLSGRIQFPDHAWVQDTPVASAFHEALCDALLGEDPERLRVRCGVTRDEANALRFMCKVEYAADASADGPAGYAWSWWSPLVETPQQLVAEVRGALRQRRDRLNGRTRRPRALARADKARGPAHGTWSTESEMWELGRSDGDGFCRNRRSRWSGQAESARPLRPRHPR
jgi:hypothetical protein